jgi:uncharacterized protein (TIGR00255 family)
MSVYSMTGYASVQNNPPARGSDSDTRTAPAPRLGLEIRSVNSRFLDLSFRLPDDLRHCEPALRELITREIKRGKVEVRAVAEQAAGADVVEPSPRWLQRLGVAQDQIRAWLPDARPLGVADVMRLCGSPTPAAEDFGPALLQLAEQAVIRLRAAREREGGRLADMLLDRLSQLRELASQASPLIPQLVEHQRIRFLERWQEALSLTGGRSTGEAAQERALTEATAFAIRIDVAEEITRLQSHLDEISRLVQKGGEIGKRLDFLIQELHREANTLGSKSSALELTKISVDMKVLIEQMREQVQNIE